jgi:membrane associated rhomboid family serine protease
LIIAGQNKTPLMNEKHKLIHSLLFPVTFLVIIWLVWIVFNLLGYDMSVLGIKPLKLSGLPGIILSPFGHGGFGHLFANSTSFLVLAVFLFYFYRLIAYKVFFINWVISGSLLWLGGRESIHIGVSGLVYGLAFFLAFSGFFRKDRALSIISFIVVFLYGSMIWGMVPQNGNISWEGHLFGAISGISLAWHFRKHPIDFVAMPDGSSVSVTWGQLNQYEYAYLEEEEDESINESGLDSKSSPDL